MTGRLALPHQMWLALALCLAVSSAVVAQDPSEGESPAVEATDGAATAVDSSTASDATDDSPDDVSNSAIDRQDALGSLAELTEATPIVIALAAAPFAIASLIALWFGIERMVVLRRGRVIPKPFVSRFLHLLREGELDAESALDLCEQNQSPVAHVFAHGIRKWGKPSVEVEQAIIDGGERQVAQLRKHLRVLNGVATVTPLMGLLGTVLGMMIAFVDIAGAPTGANRTEELAFGIVTALSTTALGLTIAIPSLILYMYLAGRIDSLVMDMDALAQDVVHLISGEGLSERKRERGNQKTIAPSVAKEAG
ncbi:MotA/TolQ/ExbB proton channel family protein [Stratiformator vulcanicus]|uniref:Biopolymer transport protein ExbB n=1 Tax=Stratiformator vulcanicus TaxID=2527980 RepID=A0A517R4D6_9PLAN|nr:MotA/TolQ/ExbB proton channel family protein [Stratiformator vulcanicus]QDT38754.1 Biopolymer transport protein ExbB [Stratiformator vulcanicus]